MPSIRHTQVGEASILDIDFTPDLIAALPLIGEAALDMGAQLLQEAAIETFETQGFGTWAENTELTKRLKGDGKRVMEETGELLAALRSPHAIRGQPADGEPGRERTIGWYDELHIPSGLPHAILAAKHEFGYVTAADSKYPGAIVPPREWLSKAADTRGDQVLDAVVLMMDREIGAYNVLPRGVNP